MCVVVDGEGDGEGVNGGEVGGVGRWVVVEGW